MIPPKAFKNILGFKLYKKLRIAKQNPIFLTVSVTKKCNSRCKTCNIWKEDIEEELSIGEYRKIFRGYGSLQWVTITGGEPFLREDLFEIIKIIYLSTFPKYITITTNGLLPEKVEDLSERVMNEIPKLNLIVNVSLDAIGDRHDHIRGVPGNYRKVLETIRRLKEIEEDNLTVGINTVLSNYNINNFVNISQRIKRLEPDSYTVEIAECRARLKNSDKSIVPEYEKRLRALKYLIDLFEEWDLENSGKLICKLRKEFYRSLINVDLPSGYEGIASGYVMPGGEVWLSDSRRKCVGNLRDVNYHFEDLWFNEKSDKLRRKMRENYQTTAVNAFYINLICHPLDLIRVLLK